MSASSGEQCSDKPSDIEETAQVSVIWAVVVLGSALDPIDKDHLAGIVHRVPPWTPRDQVAQFRHCQIGTVFLEQLGCVVLTRSAALVAPDPDQRQGPLAQEPCSSTDHRFSPAVNHTPTLLSVDAANKTLKR